jgi:hypothetical protein
MIPIIGLIVATYTIARSLAEISARPDGAISVVGKIFYGICAIVTLFLVAVLLASGSSVPAPRL